MESRHAFIAQSVLVILTLFFIAALAQAQEPFNSHEVHLDGSITFRFKDAGPTQVLLDLEGMSKLLDMAKGADGIWSVLAGPLAPAIYGYSFVVDGQPRLDPGNSAVTPNLINLGNLVMVPGAVPLLWEQRNVPHGVVHHHFYTSTVTMGLPEGQSDYYVYTPPGYDAKKSTRYPTLYLLHGWSDLANGWTEVGKANFIFDNLIAEGKAKPMVVVMPLGYGDMKFVSSGHGVWDDDVAINHNVTLFTQALQTEILPRVESEYRVSKARNDRAIAGLSMGGLESLTIGLKHSDQFGWIGAFSSALGHQETDRLAAVNAKTLNLKLLWIACGTEDDLITPNRKFTARLKDKNIAATIVETPGMHTWMVWRDDLANFAPLLFQKNKAGRIQVF
jgi:enterochelin esterase-like enzyme